jgi:hypothetical protein
MQVKTYMENMYDVNHLYDETEKKVDSDARAIEAEQRHHEVCS